MTFRKHNKQTLQKRLEDFTENGRRLPNTHNTKLQLIRVGLLANRCAICSLSSWQGKPISLHLDHIDGNPTNNLISNLRILCPNCHSQTDTYCGRNATRSKVKNTCLDCHTVLSTTWGQRCLKCHTKHRDNKTKIEWPSNLRELVENRTSMEALATDLGVSSNAIRKRCRKLGIEY